MRGWIPKRNEAVRTEENKTSRTSQFAKEVKSLEHELIIGQHCFFIIYILVALSRPDWT